MRSGRNPQEQWPADVLALYGRNIYEGMNCLSAWKVIPRNSLVALMDTIKTRILSFVLEIEEEAPDAGEASPHEPPLPQERVSQVFNTYITGSTVQNVAAGGNRVMQSGEFNVIPGDIRSLERYLESLGVEQRDIEELKTSIETDSVAESNPAFGERVQAWTGKMLSKCASGAWNVSLAVASPMLAQALAKYFGLQ